MLFCCSSNLSDSTSQTQASIVLFCFLCVCVCVCAVGVRGWLTFSASAQDRPINLSLWNAIIFEARRQNAHCQKVKYWTDDSSEESNRPLSAGGVAGCLCKLRLLWLGWNGTHTCCFIFFACNDWSDLMRTRALSYAWCEHRVAAQDCWHCYNHWGEATVVCAGPTAGATLHLPLNFIHICFTQNADGYRETIHVSGATDFRNDSQMNGHDLSWS